MLCRFPVYYAYYNSKRKSSPETIGLIAGLAAAGVPQREITERVGLSERQVRRWLRRSEEEGNRAFQSRPRHNIANHVREIPFTTVQTILDNRQSGRIPAGFWGWIFSASPGELVRVTPPRFTYQHYIRILQDILLPSVRLVY